MVKSNFISLSISRWNKDLYDDAVEKIKGKNVTFADIVFACLNEGIKTGYLDKFILKQGANRY